RLGVLGGLGSSLGVRGLGLAGGLLVGLRLGSSLSLGRGLRLSGLGLAQLGVGRGGLARLRGGVPGGLLALEGALGTIEALEGLPVTGHLQQGEHLLAGLGADAQPVPGALAVDVDERGLLGGVVLADLLDHATVALGARVGDDNSVVRRPDLAEALET